MSINKEAKKLNNPTGNLKSGYLSIKDLMQKGEEKEKKNTSLDGNKPTTPFAYDDLKMAWRKYAYIAKDKGLDTLFSALTVGDPLLEDNYTIKLFVSNEVQKNFVDTNETDLLTYLRQSLNNYAISLSVEVGSESSEKKQLYSGQDKFKDMAERNPHLKTLQQRFKLDIEF